MKVKKSTLSFIYFINNKYEIHCFTCKLFIKMNITIIIFKIIDFALSA